MASSGCIGLLLGLGVWLALPNQYPSRAIMELDPPDTKLFTAEATAGLTRTILTSIIQKEKLCPASQGKKPLEDIVAQMKNKIEFSTADPKSVAIQFRYSDPLLAQSVSDQLVQAIFELSITDCPSHPCPSRTLRLKKAPTLSKSPASPNLAKLAVTGLLAGLLTGLIFTIFYDAQRPALP